jgi:putative ABC transport system permease protein
MMTWVHIGLRNVWRNRRRSRFLISTVAIGAIALLVFVSYIVATAEGMRESIIRSGTGHLQIGKVDHFNGFEAQQLDLGLDVKERQEIETVLANDARVRRVVPRLSFSGLISTGDHTLTFQATATDPKRELQAFGQFRGVSAGQPLSAAPSQAFSVLLGAELARRLGAKPGDTVTLMTSTVSGAINALDLTVVGLTSTGSPEADLYSVKLPISAAQELLRTSKISRLVVLLNETGQTEAAARDLGKSLAGRADVRTWTKLSPIFDQVISMYRNQFLVFGAIIGIVVFLSVAAMTLTNIFERTREIGTLKAVGISSGVIRFVFTLEGFVQGAAGALVGCAISAVLCYVVNRVGVNLPPPPGRTAGVPLRLLWSSMDSLPILVFLPLIATFASFWISRRTASLPIVTALYGNQSS